MKVTESISITEMETLLQALLNMPNVFDEATVNLDSYGIQLPPARYDYNNIYYDEKDVRIYKARCSLLGIMPFSVVDLNTFSRHYMEDFKEHLTSKDMKGMPFRMKLSYKDMKLSHKDDENKDAFNRSIDQLVKRGYTLDYALFSFGTFNSYQNLALLDTDGIHLKIYDQTFLGREPYLDKIYSWFSSIS
ncbi:MAG: hypothetical protein R6V53_05240 [Candidatus Woesearchaeota archaeon]